jgi:hypothetical protein
MTYFLPTAAKSKQKMLLAGYVLHPIIDARGGQKQKNKSSASPISFAGSATELYVIH